MKVTYSDFQEVFEFVGKFLWFTRDLSKAIPLIKENIIRVNYKSRNNYLQNVKFENIVIAKKN